jgi:hypothetical protein
MKAIIFAILCVLGVPSVAAQEEQRARALRDLESYERERELRELESGSSVSDEIMQEIKAFRERIAALRKLEAEPETGTRSLAVAVPPRAVNAVSALSTTGVDLIVIPRNEPVPIGFDYWVQDGRPADTGVLVEFELWMKNVKLADYANADPILIKPPAAPGELASWEIIMPPIVQPGVWDIYMKAYILHGDIRIHSDPSDPMQIAISPRRVSSIGMVPSTR